MVRKGIGGGFGGGTSDEPDSGTEEDAGDTDREVDRPTGQPIPDDPTGGDGGDSDGGDSGDDSTDVQPTPNDPIYQDPPDGSTGGDGGDSDDGDSGSDTGSDETTTDPSPEPDPSDTTDPADPTKGGVSGGDDIATGSGDDSTDVQPTPNDPLRQDSPDGSRDPSPDQDPPRGQPTPPDAGEDDVRPETRDLFLDRMDDPDRGPIDPGLEEDPGRVDAIDDEYQFEGTTAEAYVSQRRAELREAGYEPDEFSIRFSEDQGIHTEFDEELIAARDRDAVRQEAASALDAYGAGDIGVREVEQDGETMLDPYVTDEAIADREAEQLAERERDIAAELGVSPSEVDVSTEWDRSAGARGMVTGGDPTQQVVTDLSPEAERAALADQLGVDLEEVQLRGVGPASGDPRKPGMDPGREDTPYLTEEGEVSLLAEQTDLDESDIAGVRREDGQLTPELTPEAAADRIAQQNEDIARADLTIDEETGEVRYDPERERIFERSTPVLGQVETYYAPDERLFAEDTPVLGATESVLEPDDAPRTQDGTQAERLLRLVEAGNIAAIDRFGTAIGEADPYQPGGVAAAQDPAIDRDRDSALMEATGAGTAQFLRLVEPAGIGLLGADAARFGASELQAEIDEVEAARETVLDPDEGLTPGETADVLPFLGPSTFERRREQAGMVAAAGAAAGGAYGAAAVSDPLETGARTAGAAAALTFPPLAARGALRATRSAGRGVRARTPDVRSRLPEARIERRPGESVLQLDDSVRQQLAERASPDGGWGRMSDLPSGVTEGAVSRAADVREVAGGAATGAALRAESNLIRARNIPGEVADIPSRTAARAADVQESATARLGEARDVAGGAATGAALRAESELIRARNLRGEVADVPDRTLSRLAEARAGVRQRASDVRDVSVGTAAGASLRAQTNVIRARNLVDRVSEPQIRVGERVTDRLGGTRDVAGGAATGAALRAESELIRARNLLGDVEELPGRARSRAGDVREGITTRFEDVRDVAGGTATGAALRTESNLIRAQRAGRNTLDRLLAAPSAVSDLTEYSLVVGPRRPPRRRTIDLTDAENIRITEIEDVDVPTASSDVAGTGATRGGAEASGQTRVGTRAPGTQTVTRTERTLYESPQSGGLRAGPVDATPPAGGTEVREFEPASEVRDTRAQAEATFDAGESTDDVAAMSVDVEAVEGAELDTETAIEPTLAVDSGMDVTADAVGVAPETTTGDMTGPRLDRSLVAPEITATGLRATGRGRGLSMGLAPGAPGRMPPSMPPVIPGDPDGTRAGVDQGTDVGVGSVLTDDELAPGWLTETYVALAGIDRADLDVDPGTESLFGEFGFDLSSEQAEAFAETRELLRV